MRKCQLFTGFEYWWALRQHHSRSLKQSWRFCHAATKTHFFQSIFICIKLATQNVFLVWFVHLQKGYPFWSLEHQSRNKPRAGSPFLPKCLVRHSKSYSQEQIVCYWDSCITRSSCLICSLVPGPSLTWKTLLAPYSSSGIVLSQQQAWAANLDSVLLSW